MSWKSPGVRHVAASPVGLNAEQSALSESSNSGSTSFDPSGDALLHPPMDDLDTCGNPESPLPVHQGGSGALLAFERLPSESSGSDTDELCSHADRYINFNPCDAGEVQSCGTTQLLTDCGDSTGHVLDVHASIVPCPQFNPNEQSCHRRSSVAAVANDGQSYHIWSTRKSVRELYGKPSWWGDDTEPLTAPATPVGNGPNVKMIREQNTVVPCLLADTPQPDPCETPVPRRSEVFLIDFGGHQVPGIRPSSTSGDLRQCVPDRIRRAFDERERQKKERELQKEQLRRQSTDKLNLSSVGNAVCRTATRAPLSARSAVPTSSSQPGRPTKTGPLRSHLSTSVSKPIPQRSAPVTPRSDISSRFRFGAKPTTTTTSSSYVVTQPESRASRSATTPISNRTGAPRTGSTKRDAVTRTPTVRKGIEAPTNLSSTRRQVTQIVPLSRTATPVKRTPAKTVSSTMKATAPTCQNPATVTPRISSSGAAAILSRSTTQRSSLSARGTRSFMSGTASSGAKCIRVATTHTDRSTASSHQMSAPLPCNSIKRPITTTRLRQPAKPAKCATSVSNRSVISNLADRRSVQFKLDKPKSLDWTSTLMAELDAYDDPKAYLFHRMFQGSEHAETVSDDVFESVVSLSLSSSHKATSPPDTSADPDPTLPDEPSQRSSSLPVRCLSSPPKPDKLEKTPTKLSGTAVEVADNTAPDVSLNGWEMSARVNLSTSPSVTTPMVTPHRKVPSTTVSSTPRTSQQVSVRLASQVITSDSLSSSMMVSASALSLAPSYAGTYILEKNHSLASKAVLHHEHELDSVTPRGSLIDLVEASRVPQAGSPTHPTPPTCGQEYLPMTCKDPSHVRHKPEYLTTSNHLDSECALTSNCMVFTDMEGTGIRYSVHGTNADTYQDSLDTEGAAALVHSSNALNDSLLASASIISLAPSCTGTYVLDVDDTLASQGVPPVVIKSREDLLNHAEVSQRLHKLAKPESVDKLAHTPSSPDPHHLVWLAADDDQHEEEFAKLKSPSQPSSLRHDLHTNSGDLAITPFSASGLKDNLTEVDRVRLELRGQLGGFRDVKTAMQSAYEKVNPRINAATTSDRSRSSAAHAQFITQHSPLQVDSDSPPRNSLLYSRTTAYPVRLPCPAQSPTLSSDSSPPPHKNATSPFAGKSEGPTEHRTQESPILVSSTGASASLIDPLTDMHDCYRALQASVNYLIKKCDGNLVTGDREPLSKLDSPTRDAKLMDVPRRPHKWTAIPASRASVWHTKGIQRSVWRHRRYDLQHQSTASLDSALDGFRDVLASTSGDHQVTAEFIRNGSASVPQPSSPSPHGDTLFPWATPMERPDVAKTDNGSQKHARIELNSFREASPYKFRYLTSDYNSHSSSNYGATGILETTERHSGRPVHDSTVTDTFAVDSRTFSLRRKISQVPGLHDPVFDSSTYKTWMADMAVLSEGIDNLAQTQLLQGDKQKHADLVLQTTDQKNHCELPDSTTGPLASDAAHSAFTTPASQRLAAPTFKGATGYGSHHVYEAPDYSQNTDESGTTTGVGTSLSDPNESAMYYTLLVNSIRHLSLKLLQCSDKLIERVNSEHPNTVPPWSSSGASRISSTDSVSNSTKYALNDALKNMHTINEQLRIVDKLLFTESEARQEIPTLPKDHHAPLREDRTRLQTKSHPLPSEHKEAVLQLRNESISSRKPKWETHNRTNGTTSNFTELNRSDDDEEYY